MTFSKSPPYRPRVELPFINRHDAGVQLARAFVERAPQDPVILALPRGGVPVGYALAEASSAPLDVFVVRKLGVPGREELAMGAIATGGAMVLSRSLIDALGITAEEIEAAVARESAELERRERLFREGRPALSVRGHAAVLVDDGLATGSTMLAAIAALRRLEPAEIAVAVPVASPDTCATLAAEVDDIFCLATPQPFYGVGQFYQDFTQTSDDEVRDLLRRADQRFHAEVRP
jgi:predicted phosphoribosyltransferase